MVPQKFGAVQFPFLHPLTGILTLLFRSGDARSFRSPLKLFRQGHFVKAEGVEKPSGPRNVRTQEPLGSAVPEKELYSPVRSPRQQECLSHHAPVGESRDEHDGPQPLRGPVIHETGGRDVGEGDTAVLSQDGQEQCIGEICRAKEAYFAVQYRMEAKISPMAQKTRVNQALPFRKSRNEAWLKI